VRAATLQAGGLVLYLAAIASVGGGQAGPLEQALADRAAGLAGALERQVEGTLGRLGPLARQVAAGEPFDWRAFSRALDPGAGGPRDGDGVVVWAPRVPARGRASYEMDSGRHGYRSFRIGDADGRGGLRPARPRPDHFPVHLVDPPAPHSRILGLDLLSEPALSEAIGRAGRSGLPQVLLPQGLALTGADPRLVIVVPVARGPELKGVLLAALALPALGPPGATAALDPALAVRLAPWTSGPDAAGGDGALHAARAPFFVQGQAWAVEIRPRRR
jgi:CHASE1-domain containing sensor protein